MDYVKIGPFKINKAVGIVNYRLQLLKTIRIYPVFYIFLLKPALENARQVNVEVKLDNKYKVEKILDTRKKN